MNDDMQFATFPITVNYAVEVEELVRVGRYEFVTKDINAQNFPTTREGEVPLNAVLVHFDRHIESTDEAVKEIDEMGLRAGELHEFLTLGAQYPEVIYQCPIVVPGSVVEIEGKHAVVWSTGRHDDPHHQTSGPDLWLYNWDADWNDTNYFLAFRK